MFVEQINNGTGTVTYLHHDQAGSTRLLAGSTGTITGKCTYNAYGTPTCEGTATTPLGFDAQYTSSDTGLVYLRARAYDPATAQFLTVDPLAPVTEAPYTYSEDNPINYVDPSGLIFGIPGTPSWSALGTRVVGFFDGFTKPVFGGTAALRSVLGLNSGLETCSAEYQVASQIGSIDVQLEGGAAAGVSAEAGLGSVVGKLGGLRPILRPFVSGAAGAFAQSIVSGQEPSPSTIVEGAGGGLVGETATGFFASKSAQGVSGGVGALVSLLTN